MVETYTGMMLHSIVTEVIEIVAAPGKIFAHNVFHGIAFMGIVGVVMAIIGMRMGFQ
jgi:hypothetical protein